MDSRELQSLIYESTISPEGYDDLLEAWDLFIEKNGLDSSVGEFAQLSTGAQNEIDSVEDHFRRAEMILDQIGREVRTSPGEVANLLPEIVIAGDGTVIRKNAAAIAEFGKEMSLSDLLDACEAQSSVRLRETLRNIEDLVDGQFATIITLLSDHGASSKARHLAAYAQSDGTNRRKVLEVRSFASAWTDALAKELENVFKLTPAELDLCRLLSEGFSLNQIAEQRRRSIGTIRVQTKAILRKTYTSTQAELVRSIMMFAVVVGVRGARAGPELGQFETQDLKMPDGRNVQVHFYGDPSGSPVLFLHGMMDAFAGLSMIDEQLRNAGLKFICPARPGFGNSDPVEKRGQDAISQVSEDVECLVDTLSLGRVPIVGHLAGAAYAYDISRRIGDRVCGILAVSGGVPIRSIRQIQSMSSRQRIVALTARYVPDLLAPLLRIGISQLDSTHYIRFLDALFERGTCDRQLIESQGLYEDLAKHYRWSTENGYEGFQLDASVVTMDWFDPIDAAPCNKVLMHGKHDPVVQWKSAAAFVEELDFARLVTFPSSGQLLLYEKPQSVLAELRSLT